MVVTSVGTRQKFSSYCRAPAGLMQLLQMDILRDVQCRIVTKYFRGFQAILHNQPVNELRKKIFNILRISQARWHVKRNLFSVPLLGQMDPVHIDSSYFSTIHFNIIPNLVYTFLVFSFLRNDVLCTENVLANDFNIYAFNNFLFTVTLSISVLNLNVILFAWL
jgi:hypothetical protein